MFINCRHCNALVATDPATDLPPMHCPRCAGALREEAVIDEASAQTVGTEPEATAASEPLPPEDTTTAESPETAAPEPASDCADGTTIEADEARHTGHAEAIGTAIADAAESGTDPVDVPPAAEDLAHTEGADALVADNSAGIDAATHDAPAITSAPDPIPPVAANKSAPSFVARTRPDTPATRQRRWPAIALIAALAVLLPLQSVLSQREELAADARWRPLVSALCSVFGCEVPAWREPAALALLDRNVRPHPELPGVLRATATFRNDARWPQAWPRLVLTLSDIEGRAIGTRSFEARDYLGHVPRSPTLDSAQSAAILLDIREPASEAVAFTFDLR